MAHLDSNRNGDTKPDLAPHKDIPLSDRSLDDLVKEAPPLVDDIPNGGVTAWLQVVGSFFLFFNSWGIVNAFGVFQTYYEADLLSSQTASSISWIGSIQAFLLLIVGVATGPLYDAGYFRALIFVGSFLTVFGMMMASICKEYWEVLLAQALCVGLGSACLFIPSVAIVSTYFTTKKSFATGIAASGSSLGGIIYPIVFHQLLPRVGFGWATRTLAFIMLATLTVPLTVMKVRVKPTQKRQLLQLSAFKELPFTFFSIAEFLGFMGLYVPFFYIQSYAIRSPHTHVEPSIAFYLLVILNVGSLFGRVIPNFLADKSGPLNMLLPCAKISAFLAFCWISIHSTAGLVMFCLLYGFFSGTFVSLPPTTVVSLSPNVAVVGTRMGMSFAFAGFGLLVGNPVAGAILGTGDNFTGVQAFCGGTVAAAAIFVLFARVSKVGLGLRSKA
ncbi:hypothetical protein JMJ35_002412 [Cladonia borealis]|uniref:Major facilitator superfamily (MFS) profile domain-containing protein n=1 Tax=Cladonia borealis TaxID=184061 RepID=A0AA39R825_9LECA|nr:hypothetical protein JMJ35_002412 [Cladonia borealis]